MLHKTSLILIAAALVPHANRGDGTIG